MITLTILLKKHRCESAHRLITIYALNKNDADLALIRFIEADLATPDILELEEKLNELRILQLESTDSDISHVLVVIPEGK